MSKLHVFGCSVTQGFALPDVVKPILHPDGTPLTDQEIQDDPTIHWGDIHLYQPSKYAWPQVLAEQLGYAVDNHARRGACYNQIARQVAVHGVDIPKEDVAIVMWTYNSAYESTVATAYYSSLMHRSRHIRHSMAHGHTWV